MAEGHRGGDKGGRPRGRSTDLADDAAQEVTIAQDERWRWRWGDVGRRLRRGRGHVVAIERRAAERRRHGRVRCRDLDRLCKHRGATIKMIAAIQALPTPFPVNALADPILTSKWRIAGPYDTRRAGCNTYAVTFLRPSFAVRVIAFDRQTPDPVQREEGGRICEPLKRCAPSPLASR